MRDLLLALHLVFASVWLGCILTEVLFERALLPKGPDARTTLAQLHVRVDKVIEIPSIVIVLITGAWLWIQSPVVNRGFYPMLVAGSVAIAANAYCVCLVFKRRRAANAGDWPRFDVLDHKQHKFGAVVLIGVLMALGAAIWGRGAI